jgi:mannose-6-phosphate isomerase-like protein (cupin superfamily)
MRIGAETAPVGPGDAIAIPPGAAHQITNTGHQTLVFLCCCAPAYEHSDTVLCGEGAAKAEG